MVQKLELDNVMHIFVDLFIFLLYLLFICLFISAFFHLSFEDHLEGISRLFQMIRNSRW